MVHSVTLRSCSMCSHTVSRVSGSSPTVGSSSRSSPTGIGWFAKPPTTSGRWCAPEDDRLTAAITYVGDPPSLIASEAQARPGALVVRSTHGRGGVARLGVGSVATGAIQPANLPVLRVRPPSLPVSAPPAG
jgi:hypothetical protein